MLSAKVQASLFIVHDPQNYTGTVTHYNRLSLFFQWPQPVTPGQSGLNGIEK